MAMDNTVKDESTTARSYLFPLPDDGVDLKQVDLEFVKQALAKTYGVQSKAARLLGISRYALRHRMKKYGLL